MAPSGHRNSSCVASHIARAHTLGTGDIVHALAVGIDLITEDFFP